MRGDRLGPVRAVYAEVNHGRIERWHPAPVPFYEVGVMVDVGVYPLTLATSMLGPARSVRAWSWELMADRVAVRRARETPVIASLPIRAALSKIAAK